MAEPFGDVILADMGIFFIKDELAIRSNTSYSKIHQRKATSLSIRSRKVTTASKDQDLRR